MTRETPGTWMKVVVFSKVLPTKGLAQRKNSKQRITDEFFVSTDGRKVVKPIWYDEAKRRVFLIS